MINLELKISPPRLILITGIAMCGLAYLGCAPLPVPPFLKAVIAAIAGTISFAMFVASGRLFASMKTTRLPQAPAKASTLVTAGLYRYSRNPMYLAASVLLFALGFALGDVITLLLVPVFMLYLTRFQILPEERALENLFGDSYRKYKLRVRRWI